MRLIDADALLANQPEGCYRTSDWINAAPTVDAIPVEWIEDMLREWHKNKAPFEAIGAVSGMLVRWQKEQEAR